MAYSIGRQFNIGIGKEATRGTNVVAQFWISDATLSIDDEVKVVEDKSSVGVIEVGVGQDVTMLTAKASIEANITDITFGAILLALMGTETKSTVESGVDDHKFTVLQSAQHPSYTISVQGPNEGSAGAGLAYPLGMLDSLDLDFEINKYSTFKAEFKMNTNAAQSNTASYTGENKFQPITATFGYAANLSGLSDPTAVALTKASISFKKNTIENEVLGSQSPVDRFNQGFMCEGSFEMKYNDRTWIDTMMIPGAYSALQFILIDSDITIGAASHPTVTINLAKTAVKSVARKIGLDGIITETVKFTAFYSIGDTEMLDITLRNTRTTIY